MHYLAPFPIIFGVIGAICGLLWLVSAGADEDGGPSTGLFYVFGFWHIGLRVIRQLSRDPMSILPAFGILLGSALLIGVGVLML